MWGKKKLYKVGDIVTGNTPSTKDPANYGAEVPFIKPPELQTNLIFSAPEMLSNKGARSARVLPSHSIMVSCIGNLGKVAVNKVPVATNQQINSVIPNSNVHYKFLFYVVQSQNFRNQLESLASATTVSIVNKGNFSKVEIPDPPLPTQHRIVEKIEELFSELDNGVENLKKAQQQLKTYRQAVLKDAFEGKLTKEWREQQTNLPTPDELLQQVKAERKAHRQRELAKWEKEVEQWEKDGDPGRKPRKPRAPKSVSEIKNDEKEDFKLPNNWLLQKIGNICNVVRGGSPRPAGDPKYYDGNIPFLKVADLTNDESPYLSEFENTIKEAGLNRTRMVEPKTLLLSNSGATLGVPKITNISTTFNDGIAAFLGLKEHVLLYHYYFWKSKTKYLRAINQGAAQPNLNTMIIAETKIPICSEKEMGEIVNEIESRLSVVDQLEQTNQENLQKAVALRQSILKKAFGGELVEE